MFNLDEKIIGVVAALGSAASWALGAVLFKSIARITNPQALNLAKSSVAVILLGSACAVAGFEKWDVKMMLWVASSGIVGVAVGDTLFFRALHCLSPVSLLSIMLAGQILTILMALLLLNESPTIPEWWGMLMILGGIVMVVATDLNNRAQSGGFKGILYGFGAIFCMAVSMVMIKSPLESAGSLQTTTIRMASGSLALLIVGQCTGSLRGWVQPFCNQELFGKFFLAVFVVTFGGFWMSIHAVKHLDLAVANTLNSTEPLFALPLAWLLLGERPRLVQFIGVLTIFTGVYVICMIDIF